ncbi:outer membrane beta-barrel protein [Hymenobacter sp. BT770]|uniref:outer membrane beta-barrel protein n=1 Tax=Hymenobacter sp. BT770 TaxID=2886942 RepID=UPI001D117B34|nr:outer membrane beta-barrel protein [Hymenobacter sp. BT770]MCC3154917.1 porin [Hymenobacter sp. BT770]MDO3417333.1 outer membrane beta-barrel protein [Hymenobacter sp. BT770]
MKHILLLLLLTSASLLAHGQADSTDTGKLTLSGYLDSYYLTALNRPKSGNLLGVDQLAGRAFDRLTDQFALGLVQLKLGYSSRKSDVVVDLTFGPNAEMGNFGNTTGAFNSYRPQSPYGAALYGTSAAIKQAYFTYRATPKLSFTVGQFGTHIGYEVIDAPLNYHYSLSNLFNNGPFYHVGLKAVYAFSDRTSLMVGVVNNWDNLTDDNKQKSLISQFTYKPLPTWTVYLNWIGGHGDDTYLNSLVSAGTLAPGFGHYNRQLFDLTTNYQVTPKFYLGLNAAYGRYNFDTESDQETNAVNDQYGSTSPGWGGAALYTNYAFSDVVGVGVRYEYFEDKHAVRYLQATNRSLTVTAPITLAAAKLLVKPELRFDSSPSHYYENALGQGITTQTTLGVAFIYKY